MAPFISRIRIYPIKSLDHVELQQAKIGIQSLQYDREFALLAADGRFMNGKRSGKVNELKTSYDLPNQMVILVPRIGGEPHSFHMVDQKHELESFLTQFFGEPVSLVHSKTGQLMDIPVASSVTIVSEASLNSLHEDFPDRSLEDVRLRFRVNIEISGVDPFWEESLIGKPGTGTRFTAGEVEMIAISPRARCNVPPRDPLTGVPDRTFIKKMMQSRQRSLPGGSFIPSYGSLYHLTINTYLSEAQEGKWIRVGDQIKIIEEVQFEEGSE
jgi:uncharacterized protein YcbX